MQVNVKYVNFPKPGGKYGSIKLADGQMIMVPPDLLGQFRAGMVCEISTKQQTWGTGTPEARLVTIATSGPMQPQNQAAQNYGGQAGYQGAGAQQGAYRSNTGFQPRVVQGGGAPQPRTLEQDRMIFVTGVVGRAMGSGKFTTSEIGVLTVEANAAFERLRNPPRPAPAPMPTPQFEAHQRADTGLVGPPEELGDPGPEPR
jgi:hypothetical protein